MSAPGSAHGHSSHIHAREPMAARPPQAGPARALDRAGHAGKLSDAASCAGSGALTIKASYGSPAS